MLVPSRRPDKRKAAAPGQICAHCSQIVTASSCAAPRSSRSGTLGIHRFDRAFNCRYGAPISDPARFPELFDTCRGENLGAGSIGKAGHWRERY